MGVLKFRHMLYAQFDVDPFRYITISSVCLNLYLNKFMPLDTTVSNDATKPISTVSQEYFASKNNPDILREHFLPIHLKRLKGDRHKNKIKFDEETEHETYYKGEHAHFVVDGLD